MSATKHANSTSISNVIACSAAFLVLSGCSTHNTPQNSPASGIKYVMPECAEYAIFPDAFVSHPRALTHQLPQKPLAGPIPAYACVHATINEEGKVVDKKLLKTNNEEFAKSFLTSLDGWTYEPPTQDGKPTSIRKLYSSSAK